MGARIPTHGYGNGCGTLNESWSRWPCRHTRGARWIYGGHFDTLTQSQGVGLCARICSCDLRHRDAIIICQLGEARHPVIQFIEKVWVSAPLPMNSGDLGPLNPIRTVTLLNHMGQFVSQQPPTIGRRPHLLTFSKHDAVAQRKCPRSKTLRNDIRPPVRVNPHILETMPEMLFHELAFECRQWPSNAEHGEVVHDGTTPWPAHGGISLAIILPLSTRSTARILSSAAETLVRGNLSECRPEIIPGLGHGRDRVSDKFCLSFT